jgi:hypothetical protein
MLNLAKLDATIPHPFGRAASEGDEEVPPILDPVISVVPPVMEMKGDEMETESSDSVRVHPVIDNDPLSRVMMEAVWFKLS